MKTTYSKEVIEKVKDILKDPSVSYTVGRAFYNTAFLDFAIAAYPPSNWDELLESAKLPASIKQQLSDDGIQVSYYDEHGRLEVVRDTEGGWLPFHLQKHDEELGEGIYEELVDFGDKVCKAMMNGPAWDELQQVWHCLKDHVKYDETGEPYLEIE